ncbi:aspartyl/glutamyl-tRNA amidotransferase subunit C [uncultured Thermanaerothrix sp.]|uniref:Asp-tRNA(Asn)/Glu-tRNA(Gln) amidotransferase subunit GatC n=1 Tax=uncultured Thermanaerothrix sp. TaxID=1195149 RepID=UPI00260C674E|nr:aspartyl/glutamyl-tRNA amidotransferase subunit C [uncultured Thermanaerothrix sp.]
MPAETITPETFDHLVRLAALELDEAQAEYLRRELNRQLSAIHELEAIPLDDSVPITSHGVPYPPEICPPLREDAWQPFPDVAEILDQAPQVEEGYVVVPDIPHTTLE